jgi:hypothetical protein
MNLVAFVSVWFVRVLVAVRSNPAESLGQLPERSQAPCVELRCDCIRYHCTTISK